MLSHESERIEAFVTSYSRMLRRVKSGRALQYIGMHITGVNTLSLALSRLEWLELVYIAFNPVWINAILRMNTQGKARLLLTDLDFQRNHLREISYDKHPYIIPW